MKRNNKLLAIVIVFILSIVMIPATNVDAAAKAKLNKKKATIYVGKTVQLKVKNNSKKVTWSSSNNKVATVTKKGKVKGKKAGKATITAKIGSKKYKCKITVKKKASTYPNIKIKPISTVCYQPLSTKYYSMKIKVTNNSPYDIKFNNSAMIYHPDSEDKATYTTMIMTTDGETDIVSATNIINVGAYSSAYIYGYEGTDYPRITSFGKLSLYANIDGTDYMVYCNSKGNITYMKEDY